MKRRPLIWKIYPTYLIIILISILAVSGLAVRTMKHMYMDRIAADLRAQLLLAEPEFLRHFRGGKPAGIDRVCKNLGRRVSTRFTVILPDGKVVGDTLKDPVSMDNHADRPEVIAAKKQRWGHSSRYSYTLKRPLMYVAHSLKRDGRLLCIIRAALPVSLLNHILGTIYQKIFWGGILIAALAALLSFVVAKKIAQPIREMTQVVQWFAEGKLDERVPPQRTLELSLLSEAMNQMAAQLRETIEAVTRQKQELEVILTGMSEGVIAVNMNGAIISINTSAADLLGKNREELQGRDFYEVVRSSRLQNFIRQALEALEPQEITIPHGEDGETQLQLRGAPLRGEGGRKVGAVIVMNNITRLHHLEIIRRDFVANVSHELKTPITAIRGAVETLQDVALQRPEDARRFLDMLSRQVEKLSALIEDLLSLARIEQGMEKGSILFERIHLTDPVRRSVEDYRHAARKAGVTLRFFGGDDEIILIANPHLIEQAVSNLIDNAIKYTPEGGEISVDVRKIGQEAVISVKDTGIGIPAAIQERIFERFYRVDKSRSRALGGTGLGLSLVKHIMNAHKGRVEVRSQEGKGSVFMLIFQLSE